MFRNLHAPAVCFAVITSAFALGLGTGAAGAAASCDQRVLTDWSDNGRIDGIYALRCYEEAIDTLPVDLRDYTNAEQVIGRALTTALRRSPSGVRTPDRAASVTPAAEVTSDSPPLVLVAAAGASLLLLAAGGVAYASRRRRGAD